jgi:zinc transport system substrate-binding protein
LDASLADELARLGNRTFLVFHPAWGYFADAYGLEQIPIERAGKEPGPRRLTALIEQAKAAGTRAIFVQPEFDRRTAQQVARSIGGRVEVATPLAADYVANLKRFAAILVDANRPSLSSEASPRQ